MSYYNNGNGGGGGGGGDNVPYAVPVGQAEQEKTRNGGLERPSAYVAQPLPSSSSNTGQLKSSQTEFYTPQQQQYQQQQQQYDPSHFEVEDRAARQQMEEERRRQAREAAVRQQRAAYEHAGIADQDDKEWAPEFMDRQIRKGFVRKVFTVVFFMMLVVSGMIVLFNMTPSIRRYIRINEWVYFIFLAAWLAFYLGMMCCCTRQLKKYPTNYVLLGIFTLLTGAMVGSITTFYDVLVVVIAFLVTAGIVIGIILVASLPCFPDFTACIGVMTAISFGIMFFLLFAGIFVWGMTYQQFNIYNIVITSIMAVVLCIWLVIDVQMIVGGKNRTYQLGPDDYAFAAVVLFVDIIQIFLVILSLTGSANNVGGPEGEPTEDGIEGVGIGVLGIGREQQKQQQQQQQVEVGVGKDKQQQQQQQQHLLEEGGGGVSDETFTI